MLRRHLAAQGLRGNTLLIYCGDNGTSADAALGFPHRGMKGQVYEGGMLVPGVAEWPARIRQPPTTRFRVSTSDLLPTLCTIAGQPLPPRPLDGMDLGPLLDGVVSVRPTALCFWEYNTARFAGTKPQPYIAPEFQAGTTPLAKLMGGKATRDFTNFHHPPLTAADTRGPRAITEGRFKLVLHDTVNGEPKRELFDLEADPAETTNILEQQPAVAKTLQARLSAWQDSVLRSLTGADYARGHSP